MTDRELSGTPSMAALFARAGVAMVPGATRLPFVAGGGGAVPELTLVRSDVAIDRDRLAAYDRVCGFDLSGEGGLRRGPQRRGDRLRGQ
jgi:hypothetical protein